MELRHPWGLAGSHPSYAVALAVIGHFLAREQGRGLLVAELGTGFFVSWHDSLYWGRACHGMVEHHEILDQTGSIQGALLAVQQAREPARRRLFRKAQEPLDLTLLDFFQALGKRLDRQKAVAITLIQTNTGFRIAYWVDKATFVIQGRVRLPISLYHDETIDQEEMGAVVESERSLHAKEFHAIEHILRTSPRDGPALFAAIANLEDDLRYGEAEELALQVAAQLPEREEAHYHAARYALARGDLTAAVERLRPALAGRTPAPEVLDLQARLLWAAGKREEALGYWKDAVGADPPIPVHHQRYARALSILGRHEEAALQTQATEESTIAPTREMALEMLAATLEEAPQAPRMGKPIDHAPSPSADSLGESTGLHPFLTGEETRDETYHGPLVTRMEAVDWAQEQPQPLARGSLPESGTLPSLIPDPVVQPPSSLPDPESPASEATEEDEIATLRALLNLMPDDPALLRRLGFTLARKGRLDEAAEIYRKAREVDSPS